MIFKASSLHASGQNAAQLQQNSIIRCILAFDMGTSLSRVYWATGSGSNCRELFLILWNQFTIVKFPFNLFRFFKVLDSEYEN